MRSAVDTALEMWQVWRSRVLRESCTFYANFERFNHAKEISW